MKTIPILPLALAAIALPVLGATPAKPDTYPSRPIRIVVPFPPGASPNDITARILGPKLAEQMHQQVVVDNRPGAAGTIGTDIVSKSTPDGHTLLIASSSFWIGPLLQEMSYDAIKDFTGVTALTRLVGMLGVHPSMPVRTTKDFIALARARPGQIFYGSAGIGAFQHLSMSSLAVTLGLKMNHVPFKGGAPAVVALMGGEIHAILTPVAELYPYLKSRRVRPIAVSSEARAAQFPDVPTIGETVKGFEFTSWFGAFVPAGTPKPIVDKLNAEIKKALADPDVAAKLSAQTLDPMYMTPEDFAKHLKVEYDRLKQVVKDSGARIE